MMIDRSSQQELTTDVGAHDYPFWRMLFPFLWHNIHLNVSTWESGFIILVEFLLSSESLNANYFYIYE